MANTVTICHSSNQILAELLMGDSRYKPNVMYVEFQAGTSPVTDLPSADPADLDYYLRLREKCGSHRDFLRIPVVSTTVKRKTSDSSDIQLYFNGLCIGNQGVGGKSTLGAVIYGIALAASPTFGALSESIDGTNRLREIDDITRDILWARGYYAPENQIPFSTTAQTSVTFKLNLTT